MPRIPMGNEAGLGNAQYQRSAETPVLGRPVAKEVGPARQVNRLDVKETKVAPLSQIKPVLPGNEGDYIQHGLDRLAQHAEQLNRAQQEEIRKVSEAAERTSLMVTMGDQKAAYKQNTLDIINHPEMPVEEKAKNLQTLEDDFRATIQTAKPQYQPVVASEVMGTIGAVKVQAQEVFLRNQQDSIKADLEKRASQLTLDAAQTGTDGLPVIMANFDALQGAFKSAGLTDAHFVESRMKFEQGILQNDIMGSLKSVDVKSGPTALAAVTELLTKLDEKDEQGVPKNWTRLDPATRNADIAAAINKKNQIEADMAAQMNKQASAEGNLLTVMIDNYRMAKKNGDPISEKDYIKMHQLAQSVIARDPDKSKGYMALNSIQKINEEYNFAYDVEQKAKNPFRGTPVRPFGPEVLSNPEVLAGAVAERLKFGQYVKQKDGLMYTPFLTGDETKAFTDMGAKDPKALMVLVKSLGDQFGENKKKSLEFMAAQIGVQGGPDASPVSEIIAYMAKGDLDTASTIADGMKTIKDPSFTMPAPAKMKDLFKQRIGDALTESTLGSGILFKTFEAAYADGASRNNFKDGNPDSTTADNAFKLIAGSVVPMNGSSVLLPKDMPENKFIDWKQSITPETVQYLGGIRNMDNESAVHFIQQDARWKAVADGVYTLEHAGQIVQDKKGQKFYLDVNTPILNPKGRAPESVMLQADYNAQMLGH